MVNLNMVLDQVAKDKGIERSVLVDTLQNAIAQAAKKHFGQDRAIEATYNEDKQVVEVFQTLTVVERVEVEDPVKAVNQISLEEAGKKGIEAEVGDELLFQIFYRPEDMEEARVQDERYGDILHLKTYRKEFGRIAQAALEAIQAADDLLELGALLAQLLRSIGGIPDSGLLELALYFLQPLMLVVVIKDTSSKRRCARRGL